MQCTDAIIRRRFLCCLSAVEKVHRVNLYTILLQTRRRKNKLMRDVSLLAFQCSTACSPAGHALHVLYSDGVPTFLVCPCSGWVKDISFQVRRREATDFSTVTLDCLFRTGLDPPHCSSFLPTTSLWCLPCLLLPGGLSWPHHLCPDVFPP